jgi:hypothetical protein
LPAPQLALEAAEGVPGASKRLGDLRTTIANAQRDVAELEKAHAVAARLDRQSDAAGAAAMRAEQFAIFKKHADARLKAMATVMDALATVQRHIRNMRSIRMPWSSRFRPGPALPSWRWGKMAMREVGSATASP